MAAVDDLQTEYDRLAAALSTLPVIDISEEGRSISARRKQILEDMQAIREQIASAEAPIFKQSRIL